LRKILLQNQQDLGSSLPVGPLGDIGGNIKEEIESNPPSVDASVSSDKAEDIGGEGTPRSAMNDQDQDHMALTTGINGQEVMTGRTLGLPSKLTFFIFKFPKKFGAPLLVKKSDLVN